MRVKKILSRCSLEKREDKDQRRQRSIRMKSLPDEDAGVVFWEDFCDLHGWPKTPNTANIRRYIEVFVNDKEKKINRRRVLTKGYKHYISGHDLFIKPVLRLHAQFLNAQTHPVNPSPMMRPPASFVDLPPEVQVMMVSRLDNQQDLHSCTLVSHDWHNFFNPFLWDTIAIYCDDCDDDDANYCGTDHTTFFLHSAATTGSLKKYGHHIRKVKIYCLDEELQEFLTLAPRMFSQLHSIELSGRVKSDEMIANLLWRCSRHCGGVGLRRVVFDLDDGGDEDEYFAFGEKSVSALMDHVSTLEVFCVEAASFSSKEIQRLLCSTPRLRVFNILPTDRRQPIQYESWLDARDIAQDWACTSLRVFGCPIGGISRPDIELELHSGPVSYHCRYPKGSHQESIALQKRVYSQLVRLTHLQELRMGIPYDSESLRYHRYDKENERQYDCLAMSLESGLDLLRGLQRLQVVALEDMEVGIDNENERRWVAQHWPRVQVLTTDIGTDRDDDSQLSGFYDEDSEEEFERHFEEYLAADDYDDRGDFLPWTNCWR
ncbi:hypothetical protein BGX28_000350 [Mortierella sp. GBA30]|nr:hypothetical protein BGX28_000350 [Mortierella sp. GBA30]